MDRKYSNQTGTRNKISLGTRAKNFVDGSGTFLGAVYSFDNLKGPNRANKIYNEKRARSKKRQAKRIEDDQRRRKGPSVSLPVPPRSR